MCETIRTAAELRARHDARIGFVYCDTERLSGSKGSKSHLHAASCPQVLRMSISSEPETGHRRGLKLWCPTFDEVKATLDSRFPGDWELCRLCNPR